MKKMLEGRNRNKQAKCVGCVKISSAGHTAVTNHRHPGFFSMKIRVQEYCAT